MELIENRGIQLGSLCTAHKEESLRITQAVRSYIEQYESVSQNMCIPCGNSRTSFAFSKLVAIMAAGCDRRISPESHGYAWYFARS